MDSIAILDFGSQYSQLIARRVREANVYCELFPYHTSPEIVQAIHPRGYILSGGPSSVYESGAPQVPAFVLESGVPLLGICYGMQALTHALGGRVAPSARREYGPAEVERLIDDPLLPAGRQQVWMSHGDRIERVPAGFVPLARSANSPIAAMVDSRHRRYGLQFHPEVRHTPGGAALLRAFVVDVCGVRPEWTPDVIISTAIERIRAQVGSEPVLAGISGGVDSAVAAALVQRAVGDQLTCVFVDHGLLRKGEAEQVEKDFVASTGVRLHVADAQERFLSALAGITDPEEKRKAIGREFIRVFEQAAREVSADAPVDFLVQGTLYPDVVESGGGEGTANIKSHHNVGGLPEDLQFALVEPLRTLFKDEVRAVGLELGLPEEIVWRQPFPGPGLGIRIIGEVTHDRLEVLREADAIAREELTKAGLDRDIWQCPVVLLADVRSVGVQGDGRTYGHPVVLRPVSSEDAMTADWARVPYDVLARISTRITNEVREVNRVVLDVTSKPPGTIEWE